MATFICMDGLGGHPPTTFGRLKDRLEKKRHRFILADISDIRTHEERVTRILSVYRSAKQSEGNIFFVGQSAGGSAVLIAAQRIGRDGRLAGVIPMSPAMPRFVCYLTKVLFRIMKARMRELLFGGDGMLRLTEEEHLALVSPIQPEMAVHAVRNRTDVPLKEARKLAFYPDKLGHCPVPILHLFGKYDTWIAPSAQRKLSLMLKRNGCTVETHEMTRAGHITLLSEDWHYVLNIIETWVNSHNRPS